MAEPLFMAKKYSMVCIYHISFIHSSIERSSICLCPFICQSSNQLLFFVLSGPQVSKLLWSASTLYESGQKPLPPAVFWEAVARMFSFSTAGCRLIRGADVDKTFSYPFQCSCSNSYAHLCYCNFLTRFRIFMKVFWSRWHCKANIPMG